MYLNLALVSLFSQFLFLTELSADYTTEKKDAANVTTLYPEETGRYFEGDIKPFEHEVQPHARRRVKRKFIRSRVRRWVKGGPISWAFSGKFTANKKLVKDGLSTWQSNTCLRFKQETREDPHKNMIVFTSDDGCAANVGRNPIAAPQYVSLSEECMKTGVIVHEIAHALGFWHEQSRYDRDKYVSVKWRKVDPGFAKQFTREAENDVDTNGAPYDFGSVMHYRGVAYNRYSDVTKTIETVLPGYQNTIGQRVGLSFLDVKLMNQMYCGDVCRNTASDACMHGGYPDPSKGPGSCRNCRCPEGFSGSRCDTVESGVVCGGTKIADSTWKQLEDINRFSAGRRCYWIIQAPAGQYVEMAFASPFNVPAPTPGLPCVDYIEVNNGTEQDFGNTGMRFCSRSRPFGTIVSAGNKIFMKLHAEAGAILMQVSYRAMEGSGQWSDWSGWTECTAPCGGCGTRNRYRVCRKNGARSSGCIGHYVESAECNTIVCPFCIETNVEYERCRATSFDDCSRYTAKVPCSLENKCCANYYPEPERNGGLFCVRATGDN